MEPLQRFASDGFQTNHNPTVRPIVRPFVRSTDRPSVRPVVRPSVRSYNQPSVRPTIRPSVRPSVRPPAPPPARPCDRASVRSSVKHSIADFQHRQHISFKLYLNILRSEKVFPITHQQNLQKCKLFHITLQQELIFENKNTSKAREQYY